MTQDIASHQRAARLFGVFFILTFLSYGVGNALVATVTDGPQGLAGVLANKTTVMTGFFLMAVLHTVFNIGLSVLMFPAFKRFNTYLAHGYFGANITATLTVTVGAVFLALLVPLSEAVAGLDSAHIEVLARVLKRGGFYGYQLGMTFWGLGGLLLCAVLFTSRLVPRLLSVWGLVGYLIFITGTICELLGYDIGLMLSIPGGLFELSLSLWLIIRGFNASALASARS